MRKERERFETLGMQGLAQEARRLKKREVVWLLTAVAAFMVTAVVTGVPLQSPCCLSHSDQGVRKDVVQLIAMFEDTSCCAESGAFKSLRGSTTQLEADAQGLWRWKS